MEMSAYVVDEPGMKPYWHAQAGSMEDKTAGFKDSSGLCHVCKYSREKSVGSVKESRIASVFSFVADTIILTFVLVLLANACCINQVQKHVFVYEINVMVYFKPGE